MTTTMPQRRWWGRLGTAVSRSPIVHALGLVADTFGLHPVPVSGVATVTAPTLVVEGTVGGGLVPNAYGHVIGVVEREQKRSIGLFSSTTWVLVERTTPRFALRDLQTNAVVQVVNDEYALDDLDIAYEGDLRWHGIEAGERVYATATRVGTDLRITSISTCEPSLTTLATLYGRAEALVHTGVANMMAFLAGGSVLVCGLAAIVVLLSAVLRQRAE